VDGLENLTVVTASEMEIGSEQFLPLQDKRIVLQAKVEKSKYNTVVVFGKRNEKDGSAHCIDLVYSKRTYNNVRRAVGRDVKLVGHFSFLGPLGRGATFLEINGVGHEPVCQVFSGIAPYPYFFVESVHKNGVVKENAPD